MKAIGIDIGTTSISGVLFDADTGVVLRSFTENSNAFIPVSNDFEKIQSVDRVIELDTDIRTWLPGVHEETVMLPLDNDLPTGEYTVFIGIMDEYDTLCFATDAEETDGFYKVGEFTVEEANA
jgi:uncharacterized 2Fe-2S/4Fe-4S cluster protein (DUF4445 family)